MTQEILNALQSRFGSADFTRFQILRGQKYDFARYPAAGTTQLTLFSVPVGGTDPNSATVKTYEQTNLVKSASFGQEWFMITQVRCYAGFLAKARQPVAISGDTDAIFGGYCGNTTAGGNAQVQLNNLLQRGVLNVSLAQKRYFNIIQPFQAAPAGFGIEIQRFGAAKPAANNLTFKSFWTEGSNDFNQVWNTSPIQMVEPELQLSVTVDFPDGTSPVFTNTFTVNDTPTQATPNVEVGVVFDGYVIRPQQ